MSWSALADAPPVDPADASIEARLRPTGCRTIESVDGSGSGYVRLYRQCCSRPAWLAPEGAAQRCIWTLINPRDFAGEE